MHIYIYSICILVKRKANKTKIKKTYKKSKNLKFFIHIESK